MNNSRILESLNQAESALRENLHRHDLDPTARAHMERACSHVREAFIATNEIGKARTVQQLVRECETFEQLLEKVVAAPGVVTFKIKV
jgi:hypothetical protein